MTALRFCKQLSDGSLNLYTTGADKKLTRLNLIKGKRLQDMEPFEEVSSVLFKNKIFSMDVSEQAGLIITGHD